LAKVLFNSKTVLGYKVVLACLLPPLRREKPNAEEPLAELKRLVESAGGFPVGQVLQRRDHPTGNRYLGKGKIEELADLVRATGAGVVVFDDELTAVQGRNIEEEVDCPIFDRTELILDIFASGARSRQAKLQVELAALEYGLPRLVRKWTHLERQTGGIGVRGGAGERQIEVDRRLVGKRITDLSRELKAIRKRREALVASRNDFSISLVGYTNAGKSTLMRALTGADVLVADRLFATLDTRTRAMRMGGGLSAMLSDTIGFVQRLPHHLVESFGTTLEETRQANLIVHVVDVSSPTWRQEMTTVQEVLTDIGAGKAPALIVLNKIDVLKEASELARARTDFPGAIAISALKRTGLDELRTAVRNCILENAEDVEIRLTSGNGKASSYLYRHGLVHQCRSEGSDVLLQASIPSPQLGQLRRMPGVTVLKQSKQPPWEKIEKDSP
jgi:GTPase